MKASWSGCALGFTGPFEPSPPPIGWAGCWRHTNCVVLIAAATTPVRAAYPAASRQPCLYTYIRVLAAQTPYAVYTTRAHGGAERKARLYLFYLFYTAVTPNGVRCRRPLIGGYSRVAGPAKYLYVLLLKLIHFTDECEGSPRPFCRRTYMAFLRSTSVRVPPPDQRSNWRKKKIVNISVFFSAFKYYTPHMNERLAKRTNIHKPSRKNLIHRCIVLYSIFWVFFSFCLLLIKHRSRTLFPLLLRTSKLNCTHHVWKKSHIHGI